MMTLNIFTQCFTLKDNMNHFLEKIKEIDEIIHDFLWDGKSHKISRYVLQNTIELRKIFELSISAVQHVHGFSAPLYDHHLSGL